MGDAAQTVAAPRPVLAVFFGFLAVGVFLFGLYELQRVITTTDEVRIRVYGNTVVETGRSTMVGQDKGKVVPRDNRFTRVWVRRQGRWRLVANHYSTLIGQPSRD